MPFSDNFVGTMETIYCFFLQMHKMENNNAVIQYQARLFE